MKDHHLPKKLLYGELSQGKPFQGGQKNRFKDTLKDSLKYFCIASNCLNIWCRTRDKWREVLKRGAKVWETKRNAAAELRKELRKGNATSPIAATISCSHGSRLFRTQICLFSHLHSQSSIIKLIRWSSSITIVKEEKDETLFELVYFNK